MATHSSVLAWRIPRTAEPGGLLSMGSHRVGHDWSDLAAAAAYLRLLLCLTHSFPLKQQQRLLSMFSPGSQCLVTDPGLLLHVSPRGRAYPLFLGSEYNTPPFQWQMYSPLLASPYLNDNKTYMLKHGCWDFPGGPVPKTPSSWYRGPGVDPPVRKLDHTHCN